MSGFLLSKADYTILDEMVREHVAKIANHPEPKGNRPQSLSAVRLVKLVDDIDVSTSGTVQGYVGSTKGSETLQGDEFECYNRFADLVTGDWAFVVMVQGGWEFIAADPC